MLDAWLQSEARRGREGRGSIRQQALSFETKQFLGMLAGLC